MIKLEHFGLQGMDLTFFFKAKHMDSCSPYCEVCSSVECFKFKTKQNKTKITMAGNRQTRTVQMLLVVEDKKKKKSEGKPQGKDVL